MSPHDEGRLPMEPALNSTPIKSVSSIDPPAEIPPGREDSAIRQSGPIKRSRKTKIEMVALRSSIVQIAETNQPCSVRNIYYAGMGVLWEKDSGGSRKSYKSVVDLVGKLRESGEMPFTWITDTTRYCRIDTMYDSVTDALNRTQEHYRRNLWATQPVRVEVWAESDSISGVIDPVTRSLGLGLYSCRGQASKTFAHNSAMAYRAIGKPVKILYVGDWDPTGVAIPRSLKERLERYADGAVEITLDRIALTAEDVLSGDLATHDVNTDDPTYTRYASECRLIGLDPNNSVEVEALPAPVLRDRLEAAIYDTIGDASVWNATLAYEDAERDQLQEMRARGWSV